MFESIKRFFAHWYRIPRKNVPRWVRGKLYKTKNVKDRGREYKRFIGIRKKNLYEDDHGVKAYVGTKRWKIIKFYYRKIK